MIEATMTEPAQEKPSIEDIMNAAESAFLQKYRTEIKALAEDVTKLIDSGHLSTTDDVYRWVDETVGSHTFVIYTQYNYWVLKASDNDDAMVQEWGEIGSKQSWWTTLAQMTYYAMKTDVFEELGDIEALIKDAEAERARAEDEEEGDE